MIYGEKNRSMRRDGKGIAGSIFIRCDWSDVDPLYDPNNLGLPVYNEPWPGIPNLRCIGVNTDESDRAPGVCELVAEYSTDGDLGEEFFSIELEYGVERVDITKGYAWETAGTPVTSDISTDVPVTQMTITSKVEIAPDSAIRQAINKLNDRIFLGYPAGTLRFDGGSTNKTYDDSGVLLSANTVYRFTIKSEQDDSIVLTWNHEWRPPLQARDIDGNEIIWQNIDNAQSYYTTDQSKIATPVWINQVTGQESNVAGVGGWDKPIINGKYRYDSCDFATVLNLTKAIGDE